MKGEGDGEGEGCSNGPICRLFNSAVTSMKWGHTLQMTIITANILYRTKSMRLGHLFYKQYNLQHTYAPSQKNIMIIWTTFCDWNANLWVDPKLVSPKKLRTLPLIRLISFSLAPINSCHYFCQNPPSPDQPSAQKTNLSLPRSL